MTHRERMRRSIVDHVQASWPDFAAAHPALAAVIDSTVVSEHVTDTLANDPAFQNAYASAVVAEARLEVIRIFAQQVMARMG